MRYVLNLGEDGRVLSASFLNNFTPENSIVVEELPEDNISDYKYINNQYIFDPLPIPEEKPTQLDIIEAQVTYTAMMTDTLLEV